MKSLRKYLFTFLLVIAGALLALYGYTNFFEKTPPPVSTIIQNAQQMHSASLPVLAEGNLPDLKYAAEIAVHGVVHIKTQTVRGGNRSSGNPFFGYRQEPQLAQGIGSGVIISPAGHIITNNHVVAGAQTIIVRFNDNNEMEAKLVGSDESSDIAVLKVEGNNFPNLSYGDSDLLRLGEWVLAAGNPFDLGSTITAGIVSAKARNIGINTTDYGIEAFIQTDAAVNPGNSGGALVNQKGELVGINTAIASRTGSFAGYSFAVPSSIVRKVANDIIEFGEVQRALLGVVTRDISSDLAKKENIDKIEGVYVSEVFYNGAAKEAGIKEGDVIVAVENRKVNTAAEFIEAMAQYRPGDNVKITARRNNSEKQFTATLRNKLGDTNIITGGENIVFGSEFEPISSNDKHKLNINRGLRITKIGRGKLYDAGLSEGFIITNVNKHPVTSIDDLKKIINNSRGGILVEGLYPNGEPAYFVFRN
ncbi:MAG: trypsin-like peptidase domain-containing protein [Prolixibacteraceae bacterium]|nr:trypsin-like peptidase domain-containing protein [Prolixibacteraceae bacterium]